MRRLTALLAGLWLPLTAAAGGTDISGVRVWPAPDHTRVVFDISSPAQYRVFSLDNPDRIVIDIDAARLTRPLNRDAAANDTALKRMRSAPRNGGDLRIVLDVANKVRPKSFLLPPNQTYGHRLVIDLHPQGIVSAPPGTIPAIVPGPVAAPAAPPAAVVKSQSSAELRDIVIAIDAGHGGDDTGAIGRHGTYEKDVVLAIARELEQLIRAERGLRPVMIRDGDYYASLRKRTDKARRHKADLMVSIHADAYKDAHVGGASVFIVSERGATSEAARMLAAKENAADLVGGVSLDDKDDLLASVLMDLSQSATIEASYAAANEVLRSMRPVAKLHKRNVERAGFVVLKSPDVPSILVETAFISNPTEERKLKDRDYQRQLARAIFQGVKAYFIKYPPPGTVLASTRHHVIAQGESLSAIAQRYRISIDQLRVANRLDTDEVRVGQRLLIPSDG